MSAKKEPFVTISAVDEIIQTQKVIVADGIRVKYQSSFGFSKPAIRFVVTEEQYFHRLQVEVTLLHEKFFCL